MKLHEINFSLANNLESSIGGFRVYLNQRKAYKIAVSALMLSRTKIWEKLFL